MSTIRIRADLIFAEADLAEAEKILTDLRALEAKLLNIEEESNRMRQPSRIDIHRCYHDEKEPRDCEPLDSYEKPTARIR